MAAHLLRVLQNLKGHGEGFRNVRVFETFVLDILVRCQGPDCSLRSADYAIPGVFHGRCAAALGHSRGARWQTCPWFPPTTFRAKPATVVCVDVSDEDENFISVTLLEEMNYAALTIQRGWRRTRRRIVLRAASEEQLQEKLWEVRRRLEACLPVGASAKEKTESLKEMKSTMKAVEKEWRMLFDEELANLELDLCVRSGRVEW